MSEPKDVKTGCIDVCYKIVKMLIQAGEPKRGRGKICDTDLAGVNHSEVLKQLDKYALIKSNSRDKLVEALETWQLLDSESFDKHPCPDLTLRVQYRAKARTLTEAALADAKEKP